MNKIGKYNIQPLCPKYNLYSGKKVVTGNIDFLLCSPTTSPTPSSFLQPTPPSLAAFTQFLISLRALYAISLV
jgi:hypothetical protein